MRLIDLTSEGSEIGYERFVFPDGQPHFRIDPEAVRRAALDGPIEVICRLVKSADVLEVAVALEAICSAFGDAPAPVALNIGYLLGARMDRRIGPGEPATLGVIASLLNAATSRLRAVRVLDPHSPVALRELHRATAIHPDRLVGFALEDLAKRSGPPVVVIPDQGAIERTSAILERLDASLDVARCSKRRDPSTGALSGFELVAGEVHGRTALIVDDLCDGGGTFAGISALLRSRGASGVSLCVTHGVLSRGLEIPGIDGVYTTDSYGLPRSSAHEERREQRAGTPCSVFARPGEDAARAVVLTDFVAHALRSGCGV